MSNRVLRLSLAILLTSSVAMAQAVEQQDALDQLKTLARNLKSEPDKIAAGKLQARIADTLWSLDEPFARETFRWAFDGISQSVVDDAGLHAGATN